MSTSDPDNAAPNPNVGDISDEDIESIILAFFLFIVIGLATYLFTRPRRQTGERDRQAQVPLNQQNLYNAMANLRERIQEEQTLGGEGGFWKDIVASAVQKKLVDGVMPFRHGTAVTWKPNDVEVTKWQNMQTKLCMTIFDDENGGRTNLPTRGSNIVISLQESGCEDISTVKSLALLASYYNIFIILVINRDGSKVEEKVAGCTGLLRRSGLPEELIADHRIIASHSIAGRVAFVRQMRPDAVIDFEEEVKNQLSRFGFRVVLNEAGANLGRFLQ